MKLFRRKNQPTEPATATKVTPLATGDDAHRLSAWKYTEVEEPERFTPVPHELSMVMQSFESLECEIFERIDAIYAAGGLDLGHFDVFDGYLARERQTVEASLIHEREGRRKTAARLTAIFHQQTVSESLRVRRLRAEYDRLDRLLGEVIAELSGREHTPVKDTNLDKGVPLPSPMSIPFDSDPGSRDTDSSDVAPVDDQLLRPVRDSRPSSDHNHRPFKESS